MSLKQPLDLTALRAKVLTSLLRMPLFLGLLVFLPAWSFDYWQAWLYIAIFSASVSAVTLATLRHDPALMARRLAVGAAAEPERSQQIIQGITGALSCAIFIAAGGEHRWHGVSVPWPAVLGAHVVLMLGLLVVYKVFQANSYTAATVQVESNQTVADSGPYAWVRHPMYSGSVLGYLATPLALGSLAALVPAILVCAMIVVRLLDEERYLSANLPGYREYQNRVTFRLIPFVW